MTATAQWFNKFSTFFPVVICFTLLTLLFLFRRRESVATFISIIETVSLDPRSLCVQFLADTHLGHVGTYV